MLSHALVWPSQSSLKIDICRCSSSNLTPDPAPTPASSADGTIRSMFSECRPPAPERFSGDASNFSHDGAKILFVLSHLSGKALDWAESRFSPSSDYGCSFEDFLKEFKQVFNQVSDRASDSRDLETMEKYI
uniref:DUF4939 domain-containing protein n=1 Tax=Xiphophorus couchianus TaxID=32473 RepID=A0A3B5LBJ9_9TELE